jgi:hypothetical protein
MSLALTWIHLIERQTSCRFGITPPKPKMPQKDTLRARPIIDSDQDRASVIEIETISVGNV